MSEGIKYDWASSTAAKNTTPEQTQNADAQEKENSGYAYEAPESNQTQTEPQPEPVETPQPQTQPEAEVQKQETEPEPETVAEPESSTPEIAEPAPVPEPPKRNYDPKTQEFIEWQEKTGRGIEEWNLRNRDLNQLSPLDLARDRVRRENEETALTDEEVDFLLEEELGFDPSDTDLDTRENVKLKTYSGSHLKTLKQEQDMYNKPVEGYQPETAASPNQPENGDMVTLSNGQTVSAADYQRERQEYLDARSKQVADLGAEEFKVAFEGKDGKKEYSYSYEYNDQDRHGMLSITEDVGSILHNYQNESGEFNHKDFNKDLWWTKPENRSKAISAIISKVRSEVIDEQISQRRNLNFDSPVQPNVPENNDGYHKVGSANQGERFGVKFPFKNN